MARSPLGALLLLAVAAAAAGTAGAAGADSARFEDLYLGDFSLDPDSGNRPTPEHKEPMSQQLSAPSYPACISLCSSQKRAMRRQELAQRKKAGGARMVGKGKSDNIAALEAKEQEIRHRLKELRRQKRAAAHAAHRKILTVENTADDDERASRQRRPRPRIRGGRARLARAPCKHAPGCPSRCAAPAAGATAPGWLCLDSPRSLRGAVERAPEGATH